MMFLCPVLTNITTRVNKSKFNWRLFKFYSVISGQYSTCFFFIKVLLIRDYVTFHIKFAQDKFFIPRFLND